MANSYINMRSIIFFCMVAIWIALICGCRHNGDAYVLKDVESIISDSPDSAISVLADIDTTLLISAKDKAQYHLLMADALFKAGHKDSLSHNVAHAVEYYKDHGSRRKVARAYFYSGLVKQNQKRYSSSAVDLLHSESISKDEKDTLLLAFIYRAIGDNFFHINDLKSSMSYYQKSYDLFKSMNIDRYADSVYTDIQRVKEIDGLLTEFDLTSLVKKVKTNLADEKFEEALASFYSNIDKSNNVLSMSWSSNLGAEVISYKQHEAELIKASNRRERIFWIFIIVLSIISISLSCVIIIKRNKVLKLERDSYMLAVDDLNSAINTINNSNKEKEGIHLSEINKFQLAINEHKNTIRNLLTTQFVDLSELCQTYFQYDNHKSAQKKVFEKVRELVSRFNCDEEFNNNLEKMINGSLNNLMLNFRKDFPNLNKWEYPLFMYNVFGIEPGIMALFLGERVDLIYKRKANLKRKIINSDTPLKEDYLYYLS